MRTIRLRARLALLAMLSMLAMLCAPTPAVAHLTPNSVLQLDFRRGVVEAELLVPLDQIAAALGRPVTRGTIQRDRLTLARYVAARVRPTTPDGRGWTTRVVALGPVADAYGADLKAVLVLTPPPGGNPRRFRLHYDLVVDRVANHLVMIFARRDFAAGALEAEPALIAAVQSRSRSVAIDRGEGARGAGFLAAIRLGMAHIADGHDHLLFLFTLLLTAPSVAQGRRWAGAAGGRAAVGALLRVVSAFTVGHSLTLIGAAFLGWQLPAQPVEVLIALSILITAIHAARPLFAGREALVAGLFGLVHGLAFASVIGNFLLDPVDKAAAILGFNLGIEVIQIALAAVALPVLLLLARTRAYRPLRLGGAALAALAATLWIAERALGVGAAAADVVDRLLPWGGAMLVVTAAVTAVIARRRVPGRAIAG